MQRYNLREDNSIILNDKSEKIGAIQENKYIKFNDKSLIKISDLLLFLIEGEKAHA